MEFDLDAYVRMDVRREWMRPHVQKALADIASIPEGRALIEKAKGDFPHIIVTDNPHFTFSDGSSLAEEFHDEFPKWANGHIQARENASGEKELVLFVSDMRSFSTEGPSFTGTLVHELFHPADPEFFTFDENWDDERKMAHWQTIEPRAVQFTNAFMVKYFSETPRFSYFDPMDEPNKSPDIKCSKEFAPFEAVEVEVDGQELFSPSVSPELPKDVCKRTH